MTPPPLKTDPKYGHFPWWPEDGDEWLHPDDVARARTMIPSARVFCRDGAEGNYMLMRYGAARLRVRPTLWVEVEPEGLDIGDWVEVLARCMTNEARTGIVREILWDDRSRAIRYQISENGLPIAQMYARADLQQIEPPQLDTD